MKKFVLQIAFEKCYQELLLNTQEYVNKFGDFMSPNNSCIQSLCCEYEGDMLYVKLPQTKGEEFRNDLLVFTLESILQVPLYINPNKGKAIDNTERFISQELYQEYITAERNVDPEMHFLFYVSLTDDETILNIKKFVSQLPRNLSFYIDVVALPNEISKIYKNEEFEKEDIKLMANNLQKIIDFKNVIKKEEISHQRERNVVFRNVYFLQNVDEAGHAKNFDEKKLTHVFGNLALSFIEGYDYISDKRLYDDITTFTIKTFEIDKYKIINNWAFHIFKQLCDKIIKRGDYEQNIDKDKVNKIFKEILGDEKRAFEKINNLLDNEVQGYLDEWKEKLKKKIIEKIVDANLNNGERQLLLSYFENITNRDLLDLEDFDIRNFDLFDDIYIPYIDQSLGKDNPYNKQKEIIIQIQQVKKRIEERQKRINKKRQIIDKNYRRDGQWKEGGYQIGDDIFKIHHSDLLDKKDVNQGELFSQYEPKPSSTLPKSADLKKYFPPIKNQGKQGACSSFSLTSVFEYFLNNETRQNDDMSEAFVYYNAREIQGDTNIDEGANLYNVIRGMVAKGVCLEELCPYDSSVFNKRPSDEAYEDGKEHTVTTAKDVPVSVEIVKSAINDGYPVVGCFRIFESLQDNTSGYIPMPTDNERNSEEEKFHAMVICGYNDKHGHFIVRNSWGTDFGDKGYCYLPYSYLRDSDLTRYAVAITGIDANTFIGHKPDEEDYNYDQKDSNIQYAILLNLLKEEEHKLEEDRARLKDLIFELKRVIEELKNRDDLITLQDDTGVQLDKISKETTEIQKQKEGISLGSFKWVHVIHAISLAFSGGATGYGIYNNSNNVWIPSIIIAVLSVISWGFWLWKSKKIKIKEFDLQIKELETKKNSLNQTLDEKNTLRDRVIMILNTIGDIDESVHLNRELLKKIINTLNECYDQITKYLDNLPHNETDNDGLLYKEWFKEIESHIGNIDLLKKLLIENKDGDYMSVLREIQKQILRKINNLFDKDIDSIYNNGNSAEWNKFLQTIHYRKVYAQIDRVKFESEPSRAERKQCAYLLSDLKDKPKLNDCGKTDIDSLSKNRFIFLFVKKVTLDELVLFKNVK